MDRLNDKPVMNLIEWIGHLSGMQRHVGGEGCVAKAVFLLHV